MSKFTKIALPIIVFVALSALISPFLIGYVIEKDYVNFQNSLPNNSDVAFRIENYKRGWFTSSADLVMDFVQTKQGSVSDPGKVDYIKFSNIIYHGPFIIAPKTTGSPIKFAKAYIKSTVTHPKDIPLTIQTTVGLRDKVLSKAFAEKITYQFEGPQGATLVIQGMQADIKTLTGNNHTLNLNMSAFDMFDKGAGYVRIKNIAHDSDFTKGDHDFWSGHAVTSVADLDLDTATNQKLEMQGMKLVQHSRLVDGRGQGTMEATVNEVKWNDENYGTQTIKVSARHLDVETLKKFTDAFEEQQTQGVPVLPFGKAFRTGMAFFSKGLELSVDTLDVNTEWGRINADATVTIPESQTNLGTLHDVFIALKAVAHFKLPENVAKNLLLGYLIATTPEAEQATITPEQADTMLQAWLADGWIEKNNNNIFQINLKVEKGELFVNDKLFDMTPAQQTITNTTTPSPLAAPTPPPTPQQ